MGAWEKRRFVLTPVRFVEEGGTRMGHTVVCDWKATYVKGKQKQALDFGVKVQIVHLSIYLPFLLDRTSLGLSYGSYPHYIYTI